MPRDKDQPPAVRVYTVCDESKYLIVRNVPALGCGDELRKLFEGYGEIDELIPLDDEDCEPFTDVYWIKFNQVNNARFAKRKLDESVFIGNRIQVSYAPKYENLSDTKEKLEGRRKEVLARLNPGRSKGSSVMSAVSSSHPKSNTTPSQTNLISQPINIQHRFESNSYQGRNGMIHSITLVIPSHCPFHSFIIPFHPTKQNLISIGKSGLYVLVAGTQWSHRLSILFTVKLFPQQFRLIRIIFH